jgi:hypothetical protein
MPVDRKNKKGYSAAPLGNTGLPEGNYMGLKAITVIAKGNTAATKGNSAAIKGIIVAKEVNATRT